MLSFITTEKLQSLRIWVNLYYCHFLFQFELANVTQFAAHKENKRLFGFVVCASELPGEEGMSAYVFESNTEGEKVWK